MRPQVGGWNVVGLRRRKRKKVCLPTAALLAGKVEQWQTRQSSAFRYVNPAAASK
jgi:hypothetical protein